MASIWTPARSWGPPPVGGFVPKIGGLLDGKARTQHRTLVERLADQLKPQRQTIVGKSGGDRKSRQSGQIDRYCENVVQIHRYGVGGLFTHAKSRSRRRRRQKDVATFKGLVEIALDERAQLLGPRVIGIIIARRQNISA